MSVLSTFIDAEREQYTVEDNNKFAYSLGRALTYYEFLLIVKRRYDTANKNLVPLSKELTEFLHTQGDEPLPAKQMVLLIRQQSLTLEMHLEIESFYLFGKIFLDEIAHFLQDYFGPAKNISLKSHNNLTKSWEKFRLAKSLVEPEGFSSILNPLQERIGDYRDRQICHERNQRVSKAILSDMTGQTELSSMVLNPKESDDERSAMSEDLSELMGLLDEYVNYVTALIETNRDKARFQLAK